jgi:hypothetical protein
LRIRSCDNRKRNDKEEKGKSFGKREVLLSSLGLAKACVVASLVANLGGCTPEVTINNVPYDPELQCNPVKEECTSETVHLREEGSLGGQNHSDVHNAVVRLIGVDTEGESPVVSLEMEACNDMDGDTFGEGESKTLTVFTASFTVSPVVREDCLGLVVDVTVDAPCIESDTSE